MPYVRRKRSRRASLFRRKSTRPTKRRRSSIRSRMYRIAKKAIRSEQELKHHDIIVPQTRITTSSVGLQYYLTDEIPQMIGNTTAGLPIVAGTALVGAGSANYNLNTVFNQSGRVGKEIYLRGIKLTFTIYGNDSSARPQQNIRMLIVRSTDDESPIPNQILENPGVDTVMVSPYKFTKSRSYVIMKDMKMKVSSTGHDSPLQTEYTRSMYIPCGFKIEYTDFASSVTRNQVTLLILSDEPDGPEPIEPYIKFYARLYFTDS